MIIERWKRKSAQIRGEAYALYLACKDPRVPWYTKAFAACIVAYALSPIDLIPDFIPVLGYVDDLILIPLGVALALRMVPKNVMEECRERARTALDRSRPRRRTAAGVIISIWLLLIALLVLAIIRRLKA